MDRDRVGIDNRNTEAVSMGTKMLRIQFFLGVVLISVLFPCIAPHNKGYYVGISTLRSSHVKELFL